MLILGGSGSGTGQRRGDCHKTHQLSESVGGGIDRAVLGRRPPAGEMRQTALNSLRAYGVLHISDPLGPRCVPLLAMPSFEAAGGSATGRGRHRLVELGDGSFQMLQQLCGVVLAPSLSLYQVSISWSSILASCCKELSRIADVGFVKTPGNSTYVCSMHICNERSVLFIFGGRARRRRCRRHRGAG